jgi:predicted RNA polymerase sigma factor
MAWDVGVVEELAQDALVTALAEWPRLGFRKPWRLANSGGQVPATDGMRCSKMLASAPRSAGILRTNATPASRPRGGHRRRHWR